MTNKSPRKSQAADVPADNPVGTMERFTDGLKRVLAAHKTARRPKRKRRRL